MGTSSSHSPASLPFPLSVTVSEPGWAKVVGPSPQGFVARALRPALPELEAVPGGELSVALVSDAEIAELNSRFRGKSGPTNVLAFPAAPPFAAHMQGDVVVALQTVLRECHRQRKTAPAHASHLLVHGFLHLQGFDHQTDPEREAMEALERAALARLGIDDPFVMPA